MDNETLSPEAKKALAQAATDAEREELITGYARSVYFKRCAWLDYLNGVRAEKPFSSANKT